MQFRKHQAEMRDICIKIRDGADIRNIYALVTPGGGKSALPIIAGSILMACYRKCNLLDRSTNSIATAG